MTIAKILVINGPNLNMLGIREPDIYGRKTYADLIAFIQQAAKELNVEVDVRQSNQDRKSTRLNSSHTDSSRMPSSA